MIVNGMFGNWVSKIAKNTQNNQKLEITIIKKLLNASISIENKSVCMIISYSFLESKTIFAFVYGQDLTNTANTLLAIKNQEQTRAAKTVDVNKFKKSWLKGTGKIGCGFSNLANNCYVNSVVQACFHLPAMEKWFDDNLRERCCRSNAEEKCLKCSISDMWNVFQASVATTTTEEIMETGPLFRKIQKEAPSYQLSFFEQEDAHEFFLQLLESLEKTTGNKFDLFTGELATEIKCGMCANVSRTTSTFQNLSLALPEDEPDSLIQTSFEQFFEKEEIHEHIYNCSSCNRKVPFSKQTFLQKLPRVLCAQVNRFSMLGEKIHTRLVYDLTADLSEFLATSDDLVARYNLISIVSHSGATSTFGHYVAASQTSNMKFYEFDDESICWCTKAQFLDYGEEAYLLFYELDDGSSALKKRFSFSYTSCSKKMRYKAKKSKSTKRTRVKSVKHSSNETDSFCLCA